ncbi:MAG: acylneuraminate cytidylyltransferase family protein [Halioglobus sp.]
MENSGNSVAFIFARGGSKGLPGKNIMKLGGIPLIGHAIQCAQSCPSIDEVIVSTDDSDIADAAREWGADVPFARPQELAGDQSPEWAAWQHAIQWYLQERGAMRTFISIPTTSPFRSVEDVENCISKLHEQSETDIVITVREAERSPYFNMVVKDPDDQVSLVIPPASQVSRRQDAPPVYDITTVAYVARPNFVLTAQGIFDGRVKAVTVPAERALDIDTPYDFRVASGLYLQSGKP